MSEAQRHGLRFRDGPASLSTESLVAETRSPDLNTGFAANDLKLSRRGDQVQFYVNGVRQGALTLSGPIGPSAGFVVWNEVEVRFDDLVVTAVGD